MATMIVKHKVADFSTWKTAFDGMQQTRLEHGWIGHEVFRDAADSNLVTIVNKVKSLDQAKEYGKSPELKTAMQHGGVISAPEIQFLTDEEIKSY